MTARVQLRAPVAAAFCTALCCLALPALADDDLVARGRYIAEAADCMPCHTGDPSRPFAGGLPLDTPFGPIYSPNITSDKATGIGSWTFEEFERAVRDGIAPHETFLYPAMPFDSYTKITDDDMKALWAYVATIPPIDEVSQGDALAFPFNVRYGMIVWREMFFRSTRFAPVAGKSDVWNRGAYLVEALGHCGDCHTPRNLMEATKSNDPLAGAAVDNWYAPSLTTDSLSNLDGWTVDTLAAFFKTGSSKDTTVFGPMAEVVHDSLSKLNDDDLTALATYLLDRPTPSPKRAPQAESSMTASAHSRGAELYIDNCMTCHQEKGVGRAGSVPPLADNPAVKAAQPYDVVTAILGGIPASGGYVAMPAFDEALSDQDVADLANYVRTSWGNQAPANATPDMVRGFRASVAVAGSAGDQAARSFSCPEVGGAPGATDIDAATQADIVSMLSGQVIDVPTVVAAYQQASGDTDIADAVNALVAAYCPIVAGDGGSDGEKSQKIARLASEVATVVADQAATPSVPKMAVIWAVPAGRSIVPAMPDPGLPFACPADDGKLVPQASVAAAKQALGNPGPVIPATVAATAAGDVAAALPKAHPAEVADALILAYCGSLAGNTALDDGQRAAAMTTFGETVIDALEARTMAAH